MVQKVVASSTARHPGGGVLVQACRTGMNRKIIDARS